MLARQRWAEQKAKSSGLAVAANNGSSASVSCGAVQLRASEGNDGGVSSEDEPPDKVRRKFSLRRMVSDSGAGPSPDSGCLPSGYPWPSLRWFTEKIWCALTPHRGRSIVSRIVSLVSCCIGLGQELFQLAALRLPIGRGIACAEICSRLRDLLPKLHGDLVGPIYDSMASLVARWNIGDMERLDILFIGPSCQPFSSQRSATFSATPPHQHQSFGTTFGGPDTPGGSALECLRQLRPLCACVEQVLGFDRRVCRGFSPQLNDHNVSWAKYFMLQVEAIRDPIDPDFRYSCEALEFQASAWSNLERNRFPYKYCSRMLLFHSGVLV